MFFDLFTNITIVAAILFLIGQIFRYYTLGNEAPLRVRAAIGGIFGLMGVILMIYSISVTDIIIVDLRNLAIVLAGIFGGPISVLLSSFIIALFRVIFFGVNSASIAAFTVAIIVGLGSALISKLYIKRISKFIYMFLISMLASTIALIFLLNGSEKLLETLGYYWLIYIFGAVLAYNAFEYIILNNKIYRELSYYQIMADNLLDMISTHKPEGTYIYTSPSSRQLLGYKPKEMISQNPYSLIHEDDIAAIREILKGMINTKNVYSQDYRMKRKDGQYVWVESTFKSIKDSDGNLKEIVCASRDITERKEYERKLEKQREQAIEANRLKSQFLANMSHELRTPLNSIIGFTTRIIKKSKNDLEVTQQENLMIVKEEAGHLLRIINDLLDYSKVEAGKMDVHIESFYLGDVVDEVFSITKGIMEEKDLKFEKKIPEDIDIYIKSDRIKVKQILMNLLSNAFKYTDKGTVKLIINRIDDYFKIDVIDQGVGIAKEDLTSIFEEFHQVDGSYTRKVGGTGLGLAIIKQFIEMLGGSIQVESTLSIGSAFTVYLPVDYNKENVL